MTILYFYHNLSYIYIVIAFAYILIEWHIPLLEPFTTIKNISISVKLLVMLILDLKENVQDLNDKFLKTFFQKNRPKVMY